MANVPCILEKNVFCCYGAESSIKCQVRLVDSVVSAPTPSEIVYLGFLVPSMVDLLREEG